MVNTVLESGSARLVRLQDALDAARARGSREYDALFDAPPDGMSVHEINLEKVLVRVSRAHERVLGYPPEEMKGQPVSRFIILKEASEMAMARKLSGGGTLEPYARAFVKADGTGITLLQLDRHLIGADGKITGIRTVLMPISPAPSSGSFTRPPGFPS